MNATDPAKISSPYPIVLSVALFVLRSERGERAARCIDQFVEKVSLHKQLFFIAVVCKHAMTRLKEIWPDKMPTNVFLIPMMDLLEKIPENVKGVLETQLEWSLTDGKYPDAIAMPVLLRHLVGFDEHVKTILTKAALILMSDVNDMWEIQGIEELRTAMANNLEVKIHALVDAMVLGRDNNVAATLGGGVCVDANFFVCEYGELVAEAIMSVLHGCCKLRGRRFNQQVRVNYKRISANEANWVVNTTFRGELLTDQAVVGAALHRARTGATRVEEVVNCATNKGSAWISRKTKRIYLVDEAEDEDEGDRPTKKLGR